MGTAKDVNKVKRNIASQYNRKRAALFMLSLDYAGRAINIFRANQPPEQFTTGYWTNQSGDAARTMFSNAFLNDNEIGWFFSHYERYGIYLELANDRQNEAIRPIIKQLARQFYKDARSLI